MITDQQARLMAYLDPAATDILEQFYELTRAGELARDYGKNVTRNAFVTLNVVKCESPYQLAANWQGLDLKFTCLIGPVRGSRPQGRVVCTWEHNLLERPIGELLHSFTYDASGTTNLINEESEALTLKGSADIIVLNCFDLAMIAAEQIVAKRLSLAIEPPNRD